MEKRLLGCVLVTATRRKVYLADDLSEEEQRRAEEIAQDAEFGTALIFG